MPRSSSKPSANKSPSPSRRSLPASLKSLSGRSLKRVCPSSPLVSPYSDWYINLLQREQCNNDAAKAARSARTIYARRIGCIRRKLGALVLRGLYAPSGSSCGNTFICHATHRCCLDVLLRTLRYHFMLTFTLGGRLHEYFVQYSK